VKESDDKITIEVKNRGKNAITPKRKKKKKNPVMSPLSPSTGPPSLSKGPKLLRRPPRRRHTRLTTPTSCRGPGRPSPRPSLDPAFPDALPLDPGFHAVEGSPPRALASMELVKESW